MSRLDLLDGVRLDASIAAHPAGKRRPAVRPAPESLEEALSEDDLLAVARGAGVVRESQPESTAMTPLYYEVTGDAAAAMGIALTAALDAAADAAMRHFRETNDLDGALAIYATRDAS